MERYKIKFVTHRLPHCRLLSQKCGLEGDLYSRMCMIVFLTYFHLRMTHYKMTIQSMLKALKIQFLWGWRKGQKWVRSPLSTVKQLLKSNVTPLYHSLAWEFLQIFESGHSIELQSQVKLLNSIAFQEMVNVLSRAALNLSLINNERKISFPSLDSDFVFHMHNTFYHFEMPMDSRDDSNQGI